MTEHAIIGADKIITVPESLRDLIVQHDHNAQDIVFDCPRYWNDRKIDLSTLEIYVNHLSLNAPKDEEAEPTLCTDMVIQEDMISFRWPITHGASRYPGDLAFLVCAKKTDAEGNEAVHWNTQLCEDLIVHNGLEGAHLEEQYPDVIGQILKRLTAVEGAAGIYPNGDEVTY